MSQREQDAIAQFRVLAEQGIITQHELDWAIGAIRNRHGLTKETKQQLKQTVHEILKRAKTRI